MSLQHKKVTSLMPSRRASDFTQVPDLETSSTSDISNPAQQEIPQFEPVLNSKEAAALLRIHPKTLERMARQYRSTNGKSGIPGYFRVGRWLFRRSELDAWLKTAVSLTIANPSALNRRIA